MYFQQLKGKNSSLAYLLGCPEQGKAIAVDVVAYDEAWFLERAAEAGMAITHVIDTHVHADHHSGGRNLAERAGAAYCLHQSNRGVVGFDFRALADGERIRAGTVELEVLHTPGHSDDGICVLVTDTSRAAEPWCVLTGDTLFAGGVGRPQAPGREREMAGRLFDSLHGKLLGLPEWLEVYPGHYAGFACGAGLSNKPATTLGFEKRFNPKLQISDREAFIDFLTGSVPACPHGLEAYFARNIAA